MLHLGLVFRRRSGLVPGFAFRGMALPALGKHPGKRHDGKHAQKGDDRAPRRCENRLIGHMIRSSPTLGRLIAKETADPSAEKTCIRLL